MAELRVTRDIVEVSRTPRLSYFGHIICMHPTRFPKFLQHSHTEGVRRRGRPRKKWMDNVEEDCDQCDALHLSLSDATRLAPR